MTDDIFALARMLMQQGLVEEAKVCQDLLAELVVSKAKQRSAESQDENVDEGR